jgi:hypothetical protein
VTRSPVRARKPGSQIARSLVHQFACEAPQIVQFACIIGRHGEPEMVPVTLTAFCKGPSVGTISGCVEQLAWRSIARDPIALKVANMGA